MWTVEKAQARRRARFVADQARYIADCAHTGKAYTRQVEVSTAAFVYSHLTPTPNLIGTFTYPERFGGDDKRRWVMNEFLKEWWQRGSYVYGFERHKSGLLHGHGLGHEAGLRRLSMHDAWHKRTGGFLTIEAVKSPKHAVLYIAKYIVKDEQAELEFGAAFGVAP